MSLWPSLYLDNLLFDKDTLLRDIEYETILGCTYITHSLFAFSNKFQLTVKSLLGTDDG